MLMRCISLIKVVSERYIPFMTDSLTIIDRATNWTRWFIWIVGYWVALLLILFFPTISQYVAMPQKQFRLNSNTSGRENSSWNRIWTWYTNGFRKFQLIGNWNFHIFFFIWKKPALMRSNSIWIQELKWRIHQLWNCTKRAVFFE